MSITTDRLATIVQRELAHVINGIIKNGQVGYITLTEVRVTNDMSFATVFYTIHSDDEEIIKTAAELLEENKALIRMELAKKIKNTRKIPSLIFKFDEALAYGNHINELLNKINK